MRFYKILGQTVEFCQTEVKIQMLGASGISRDKGQVDICGLGAGELDLGLSAASRKRCMA